MLPKIPTTVKLIAAELLKLYPELEPRMGKAIDLINSGALRFAFHTADNQAVYSVRSSDQKTSYVVESRRCSCPAQINPRLVCYHRIARGILVIQSANETRVAFDEAIAAEEEPPTPSSDHPRSAQPEGNPPKNIHQQNTPESNAKRVQSAGRMQKGLTIRESMDALGRRLRETRLLLTATKVT